MTIIEKLKASRAIAGVLLAYAIGYFFYVGVLGIPFRDRDTLVGDYHTLAPHLLRTDLARSLYYLHSVPPLMNLFIGSVLKAWPEHLSKVFQLIYFLAGMAGVGCLFGAMRQVLRTRFPAYLMIGAVCILPTLYIYGTWLYATHFEFCLISALLLFYARLCVSGFQNTRAAVAVFGIACILGLLRSEWNLSIFVGFAVLLAVLAGRAQARKMLLIACVCLLPVVGWYTKNYLVFGSFGTSTWLGCHMRLVVSQFATTEEVDALKAEGKVSKHFINDHKVRFNDSIEIPETDRLLISQIPALQLAKPNGQPNLNYLGIIPMCRQDLHDAAVILREYPGRYLHYVWNDIRRGAILASMDAVQNGVYTYNIPTLSPLIAGSVLLEFAMMTGCLLMYVAVPLVLGPLALGNWGERIMPRTQSSFILGAGYLAAAIVVISSAFNGVDVNRMRWAVAPAFICLAAIELELFLLSLRAVLLKLRERVLSRTAGAPELQGVS